eukprot:5747329-Pleurochrysis_carterae.AAC.1
MPRTCAHSQVLSKDVIAQAGVRAGSLRARTAYKNHARPARCVQVSKGYKVRSCSTLDRLLRKHARD